MKFNADLLKQMFSKLSKNAVDIPSSTFRNLGSKQFADIADDIPTSISFDDIADTYKNRIPANKPPITADEFITNYKAQMPDKYETRQLIDLFPEKYTNAPSELDLLNAPNPEYIDLLKLDSTPDYDAMNINPKWFGQRESLINSVDFPDGFTDPNNFAKYHTALEQGYISDDLGMEPQDVINPFLNTSLIDFNNAIPEDFIRKTVPLERMYSNLKKKY